MIESKSWNWDIVDKNDFYWNSPAPEVFYLAENWKSKNFKSILDVGCGWGRNAIFLAKHGFKLDGFDLSKTSVDTTIEKVKEQGIDFNEIERIVLLKNVDSKWIDHIDAMDTLKRGISLRGYANENPINAYKKEGLDMFEDMIERIQVDTIAILLKSDISFFLSLFSIFVYGILESQFSMFIAFISSTKSLLFKSFFIASLSL